MTEIENTALPSEPKNRSTGALVLFLLLAVPMPFCLLIYHFVLWTTEQSAIASGSLANLAWAGLIGLAAQAVVLSSLIAALWYFTKDERFKPVYAGWLGASLVAFPALLLRLLGPNNDQLGSILQILICVIVSIIVTRVRKVKIDWKSNAKSFAFFLAAFGVAPFAIFGALGSPTDTLLSFLAASSLGWLAALLMEATTEKKFLDAFGIAVVLALLGSAIGYDGAQLILLAILPSFAFAISALMPSRIAAMILTGLVAAAGLIFFDPTELTILLGDIAAIAVRAVSFAVGLGLVVGLVALVIRYITDSNKGSSVTRLLGWIGAAGAWIVLLVLFFTTGHRGFYGDRLFVILKDQADLSNVSQIQDIDERRTTVYQTLTAHANETQADLRNMLDSVGVNYTPYYLVNALEVRGGTLIRLFLLTRPEVDRVISSPRLRPAPRNELLDMSGGDSAPSGVQWNVTMIGADRVWEEFGARGEGIIVGQSDSGVDVNHPALKESYRGNTEGDDYNWFDPWNGEPSPYDESGHGTFTLGTVLGQNGIGVAPDATWFACANLVRNLSNPALYLDCMQFMLAPFPQGGNPFTDGDPTRAADVLNNSWGCPELEGCDPNALLAAANNLRAAGIFVSVATGNDGPVCSTVDAPLSIYDSVFSVGAIDQFGNVAEFSSRGPVTADGSGRIKPDIVAPGVDILSSLPGGAYGSNLGTSIAGPHVTGAVALLWSADPTLIGDIDHTEQLLIDAADPYTGDTSVGCFTGDVPNAAYGYGILNVYEAVKMALGR
ncbi:MAG TPA: S8 family serine peptidase [Anaerolineales bacterium]|nr:S8 family serine peptidase [Anaerolineales bacterium]